MDSLLDGFSTESKSDARFDDIKRKADYLRWTIESSDPLLISDPELHQIRNDLQSLNSHLGSNAGEFQHLATISSIFSGVFARLPYPRIQRIFKSDANNILAELRERKLEFEREMNASLGSIKAAVQGLADSTVSIRSEIKTSADSLARLNVQVETKLQNWDSQFSTDTSVRLGELTNAYSAFETERVTELRALLEELRLELTGSRKQLSDLTGEYTRAGTSLKAHFVTEIGDSKNLAQRRLADISSVYDVAAQTALAGGFVEASIKEKKLYTDNAWYAKLFFILGASSLAGLWLYHIFFEPSGLADILMRLPISVALFVPAVYFSSLGGKHLKTSDALQSLGLRIKAFDAYLLTADATQRKLLRAEMANVFFDDARSSQPQGFVSESTIEKISDRVGGIVEKLIERVNLKGD